MKKSQSFGNVVIIGTGLIGGSVGLNLMSQRLATHVVGIGRSEANLRSARRRKAIHSFQKIRRTDDLFSGSQAICLRNADIILLAMPVQTILEFLRKIPTTLLAQLKRGCVVTDVGSTKASIVRLGTRRLKGTATFIGGHPIAGNERSGAGAAQAELFQDRTVILTPPRGTVAAVQKVRRLWQVQGARVVVMTPARHDRLLARVSHLPHMVAYTLVNAVSDRNELATLSAGGFRDITRIASSDPRMWQDICLDNRDAIIKAMECFEKEWTRLKRTLKKGDGTALKNYFARAKQKRDQLL